MQGSELCPIAPHETRAPYPIGMPDRINPRPIFRRAMSMLEDARCPECSRAFDPVQDAETDCHRMVPLHCDWCAQRQILIHEYRAWQRQDATVSRLARR